MSFTRVFFDSFILLKRHPHFFIPKILVSFLFLPIIVLTMILLIHYNLFSPQEILSKDPLELVEILVPLFFLFVYVPIVYFIDSCLINPMYPVMVEQFYDRKRIDFRKAFVEVLKHFGTIFTSVIIFSVLFFAVMIPLLLLVINFMLLQNDLMFYLSVALAIIAFFVIVLLFYLLYPVASIEKLDIMKSIRKIIKTSLKHKEDVVKAILISLVATGLSYFSSAQLIVLNPSSDIELTLLFFALLIVSRFLVAIFATYQYVLNAVFYLGLEKGVFLGR